VPDKDSLDWLDDLLDRFGSKAENWPPESRQRAFELIKGELIKGEQREGELLRDELSVVSTKAKDLLLKAEQLDRRLESFSVPEHRDVILKNVKNTIPYPRHNFIDHILGWIFPMDKRLFWKPALVTTMALGLGFVLGVSVSTINNDDYLNDIEEVVYMAGLETTQLTDVQL
jgi:hypothetical protein